MVESSTEQRVYLKDYDFLLCGAAAGFFTRLTTQPLDVLKIRLQLESQKFRTGLIYGTYRKIIQKDGWTGLWRGHVAAQYLSVAYAAGQFVSYEFFFRGMQQILPSPQHKSVVPFVSGAGAGIVATVLSFPMDVLRTRLIAYCSGNQVSYAATVVTIWKQEGFFAFYRGIIPTFWQIAPMTSIQFGVYSMLGPVVSFITADSPFADGFVRGFLAGSIAKFLVYPFDVIKKRLQVQGMTDGPQGMPKYAGTFDCVRKILRSDGLYGFYRGLTAALGKAAFVAGFNFSFYNGCIHVISRYRELKAKNLEVLRELR